MTTASREPVTPDRQRLMGAYYTPASAADYLAEWTVRRDGDEILEPSFGDGVFLRALNRAADRRQLTGVRIRGVELDPAALARTVAAGDIHAGNASQADFLAGVPAPADAVIGNPPFVRLRHLESPTARQHALAVADSVLPGGMEPSGSSWMPFVLQASRALRIGGRLAFVLPYELTYVRYARPLWRFLGQTFSSIRVVRVFERLFPDILQDVVLLFADGHGGSTGTVDFEVYQSAAQLLTGSPDRTRRIGLDRVVAGEREFIAALLSPQLRALLERLQPHSRPARELVRFNIGYVTGDKGFFHPTPEISARYQLPEASLTRALTSSRALRGVGLHTSAVRSFDSLFLPAGGSLTPGEQAYVAMGAAAEISERYKCRVRKPWYLVPGVAVPDLVLSVFSSTPLLMLNDAGSAVSNSLLAGFMRDGQDPVGFAANWYTSLTLLECELRIHSLGGGVLIIIPGEAGAVRVLDGHDRSHLPEVADCLRRGDLAGAYRLGDSALLAGELGLSGTELELITDGISTLRRWREADRGEPAG